LEAHGGQPPERIVRSLELIVSYPLFAWRSVFHSSGDVNDGREVVAAFGGGLKGRRLTSPKE
jgi:hypothetical protein